MRLKQIRHILPRYHVLLTQINLQDIPVLEKEGLDWKIIVQELNSVKLLY